LHIAQPKDVRGTAPDFLESFALMYSFSTSQTIATRWARTSLSLLSRLPCPSTLTPRKNVKVLRVFAKVPVGRASSSVNQ
jgi:hypothetical protein